MTLRGLYAITPDQGASEVLVASVRSALEGGVALLQYRRKTISREKRVAEARELASLARGFGVPLIVNDDVELAVEAGAAGVHLGREDGALAAAKARLGDRLIGASCYDELERARRAVDAGADYVAFGSVFPSSTKPGAVRAPLSLLGQARALGVPVCAIGGITIENAPALVRAGADLVAVISDLFDAPDVRLRARQYASMFE